MIHENLLLILSLFFIMALLYMLSQRLNISYPIFLVMGGLGISFIPGIPSMTIDPDLVFLIFLPPLLFEAAWESSWTQLWKWKRSILSLGFGLVLATSLAVAYFSTALIPGFTLALGFLLGGIISPPDAIAATSVLRGLDVPKRAQTILEGESLVNDAASLTVFRFALAALLTGNFVFQQAIVDFLVLSVMGVFVGFSIAFLLYWIMRYWGGTSRIITPITLIAPYLMYLVAEQFHWSGVLAVVSGGLLLSARSSKFLNYQTRQQTQEVWATVGFLLNGFVFTIIGLQLPLIIQGLEEYTVLQVIYYSLLISGMVIIIRIVLVYLSFFLPRLLAAGKPYSEPHPGLKLSLLIGWAGMRGVVSLASALAIPLTLLDGINPFPHRNLILFITFVVILITLVFQGLTLPLFMKWLGIKETEEQIPAQEQIESLRQELTQLSLEHLDTHYAYEMEQYEVVGRIKAQLISQVSVTKNALQSNDQSSGLLTVQDLYRKVMLDLVEVRRLALERLKKESRFDDEILRAKESELDYEQARWSKK
ncbi:Na+/H+ antiporter [Siphonobacter sp. BAB-5385]|uniref:Na+/H+ antiporter n=1 Tax=Siphonobacter curvatus TaxID=2094562 RepID=A0A2S7IH13_9BACT|nr:MULTISPECIES: Na+/H+ antiporter [Siphonobacter]OZI05865.1 Na+/H+ antiporter [Siphonobacter sp. BAB-5385]PMD90511.1 Na+/H+ antiporter [Siphonobacter sp. BAB-5405]PQA54993.1 Na+/H+ antiporter [Siphonobacter curvatus]